MKFSIDNYINEHKRVFDSIDQENTDLCIKKIVEKIKANKKIITCGNGGSASTASHYITDWNKMYNLSSGDKLRGLCLTDNIGLVTAYGNDISYDEIFSGQLNSIMDDGDLLIAVSGSGNSPNIIKAIEKAHELNGEVLGVLGYDGGKAKDICDLSFLVSSWDMQICEDIHLSFGHLVMKEICGADIKPIS
jgi:D-sedoheptulose 7-phosphate isomerase